MLRFASSSRAVAVSRLFASQTAARAMCTKGNVILPKNEFTGTQEMSAVHQACPPPSPQPQGKRRFQPLRRAVQPKHETAHCTVSMHTPTHRVSRTSMVEKHACDPLMSAPVASGTDSPPPLPTRSSAPAVRRRSFREEF